MPADWNSFIGALSARGCSFSDVEAASDRKALIHSLGITDPLDVAIIETAWKSKSSVQQQQQQHQQSLGGPSSSSPPPPSSSSSPAPPPSSASRMVMAWHRMDASRLRNEPEEVQDSIIAEELSFALRGISGAIIKFSSNNTVAGNDKTAVVMKPIIAPTIPTSTAQMIQHALENTSALFALDPICKHEYAGSSLVRSAVGEAVREVCAAYIRSVADLQEKCATTSFSLSRLCTEVDGSGYAIRRLAALFRDINSAANISQQQQQQQQAAGGGSSSNLLNVTIATSSSSASSLGVAPDAAGGLTGPWLLNALHMQYNRAVGNPDDEKIIGLVLRRAARPYLRILFDWMHRGDLSNDPFKEFFVVDSQKLGAGGAGSGGKTQNRGGGQQSTNINELQPNHLASRDAIDRWENRFQVVSKQVPHFLAQDKAYKQIYTSGKYCHMLREQMLNPSSSSSQQQTTSNSQLQQDAAATVTSSSSSSARGAGPAAVASQHHHPVGGDAALLLDKNQQPQTSSSSSPSFQLLTESDEDMMLEWGDSGRLERCVHRAHTSASTQVLKMLVTRHRLVDRLKSLRVYFFVAQGDWLVNFLDAANKLLQRPPSDVKNYTLNMLLQSSISKSCSKEDPCHTYTRCSLSDATLAQAIELSRQRDPGFTNVYRGYHAHHHHQSSSSATGNVANDASTTAEPSFELLQLEVASEWPLSLILNDIFVTKLNFAFRLLLRCKVCERALHSVVWHHNSQSQRQQHRAATTAATTQADAAAASSSAEGNSSNNNNISAHGVAISLRSQLLQFVRQFQFYASHEVLEPAWKTFLTKVEMAPGINHIGSASSELCQTIMRGLALSSEHGFRILWSILDIALEFAQLMASYHHYQQQQQSGAGATPISVQQIRTKLAEWQTELYRLLTELADPNQPDSTNLLQMLVWLDFNGFYEKLGVYKVRHAVRHNRGDDGVDSGRPSFQQGAASAGAHQGGGGPVQPPRS